MIDKEKNRQIEIDKKPSNKVETEEENRSVGGVGYYVFALLFKGLIIAGWLHFCLVALVGLL